MPTDLVVDNNPALRARLWRFLRRPATEKYRVLRVHFRKFLRRLFPKVPLPVRLPFGSWWLAWNDACGQAILACAFEEAERRFVESWLQPGMTVLDIGAHHGFYTLLASRKVGRQGRVLAFEPSPRECNKLIRHLRLNRCRNVYVRNFALGSREGEAELFLVEGRETGCNSLRPPNIAEPTKAIRVSVTRLDACIQRENIEKVDLIKLDVEGAELEVLKGAVELLARRPRPIILCEVQDIRTEPWGYKASEIVAFLCRLDYEWLIPLPDGSLGPFLATQGRLSGNFVAVPKERLGELRRRCGQEVGTCQYSE